MRRDMKTRVIYSYEICVDLVRIHDNGNVKAVENVTRRKYYNVCDQLLGKRKLSTIVNVRIGTDSQS